MVGGVGSRKGTVHDGRVDEVLAIGDKTHVGAVYVVSNIHGSAV